MLIHILGGILLGLSQAALSNTSESCKVLFDGRIVPSIIPADFNRNSSIYNNQFVHGENQTFAEIVKFPITSPSMFDTANGVHKPLEMTINDGSIFLSGGTLLQTGFRRSELIPSINTGTDITVNGTTTFHWSIRNDPSRPLNLTHEYHPVWHETNDFSTSQITFLTGKPFNQSFDPTVHNPKTLRLAGRQSNSPETTFFQTPFDDDVWHNFAVTLGWVSNLLTVYYSKNNSPLEKVAGPASNDNSGGGQFHVGMLKLPTGPLGIDVLTQGYQEPHLNEGLIFGGIFIEDSSKGCVTLST